MHGEALARSGLFGQLVRVANRDTLRYMLPCELAALFSWPSYCHLRGTWEALADFGNAIPVHMTCLAIGRLVQLYHALGMMYGPTAE